MVAPFLILVSLNSLQFRSSINGCNKHHTFFSSCCLCWLFWRCECWEAQDVYPPDVHMRAGLECTWLWKQCWRARLPWRGRADFSCFYFILHTWDKLWCAAVALMLLRASPKILGVVLGFILCTSGWSFTASSFAWLQFGGSHKVFLVQVVHFLPADFHRGSMWNWRTISSFGLSVSWWIQTQILPGKKLSCGMVEELKVRDISKPVSVLAPSHCELKFQW